MEDDQDATLYEERDGLRNRYLIERAILYDQLAGIVKKFDLYVLNDQTDEYELVYSGYKRRAYALRRIRREDARHV